MYKVLGLLLLLALVFVACKSNEKPVAPIAPAYQLTTESDLRDTTIVSVIEDFYESGEDGYFQGKDSISIYYKYFVQEDPKKAIMISSGRTEAAIKYKELIYDLYKLGFSVFIHDHRGQGQSGRMLADSQMGYIDTFQFYVDDMKTFYDMHVSKFSHEAIYLLAHSLGGAIGMTYIEQYPNDFKAAAFSSPMLGLNKLFCAAGKMFGNGEPDYAIGQHEYQDQPEDFKENDLTTSEIRFDRMLNAFEQVPEAKLGGVTYQWLKASCNQFDYLFEHIEEIKIPIVIFTASEEAIVAPKSHARFKKSCDQNKVSCEHYEIEGAKHELLIESDQQRKEVLDKVVDFFGKG